MNVADYYIVGTEQVGEWRDMHCRIEGSAVNDLQEIFARIWKKATNEEVVAPKYYSGEPSGNKMVGIVNREPHTTNKIMRQFYVHAIDDAQDSIKLINPYFTLIPCIKKALKRAIKRGIKVESGLVFKPRKLPHIAIGTIGAPTRVAALKVPA